MVEGLYVKQRLSSVLAGVNQINRERVQQAARSKKVRGSTAAVFGLLTVAAVGAGLSAPRPHVRADASLTYQAGYSVQGTWLCYGWSDGSYHCTQHWHSANGRYVSENLGWVPSQTTDASTATTATNMPVAFVTSSQGGNTGGFPWGQCTWGAAALSWDNVSYLGDAKDWLAHAQARGMATGTSVRVGATVVYQPGVQGAGSLGHVAHVTQVFSDGTFEVKEMNYYGFGGGFGSYSYRHSWQGAGVAFIY